MNWNVDCRIEKMILSPTSFEPTEFPENKIFAVR